jgi:hypothetical protein
VEIKSGKTIHPDFLKSLNGFGKLNPEAKTYLIYGGQEQQTRHGHRVLGVEAIGSI